VKRLYTGTKQLILGLGILRFIVDINLETMDVINGLMRKGRYRTVQEFIITAIQNQLYSIEQVPLDAVPTPQLGPRSLNTRDPPRGRTQYHFQDYLRLDSYSIKTISPPDPEQVSNTIYGLWNRFLPTKITTRVLANMLNRNAESLRLDAVQENASNAARELGQILSKNEKNTGRKREDRISTALPIKKDAYKTKMRFKAHFVGAFRGDHIDGMPATLKFINIVRDSNGQPLIGLTEFGLKFASLENPVLDKGEYSESLSQDEKKSLIEHISSQLPEENHNLRITLETIRNGASSPAKLSMALSHLMPSLGHNQLETMRTGLISRLAELGLISRIPEEGSNRYELTDSGRSLLEKGPIE